MKRGGACGGARTRRRCCPPWLARLLLGMALMPWAALAAQERGPEGQAGDALRGKTLYESRCVACHSVDAHRVGPAHRGLLGRRVGGAPGYAYSPAMAAARQRWTPQALDIWLADPERLVPGQRMGFQVEQAQDRADLIAYLATLK